MSGGWSRAVVTRALGVAAVSVGVGFALGSLVGRAPPGSRGEGGGASSARRVTEEEQAFLAPLAVGSEVGGFRVTRVRGVTRGALTLELARGQASTRVDIARLGGAEPSATFGDFGVYYAKGVSREEGEALAKAVASALANAANRPPPAGIATLRGAEPL